MRRDLIDQAANGLSELRAVAIDALLATPEFSDIVRLDRGFLALTGTTPPELTLATVDPDGSPFEQRTVTEAVLEIVSTEDRWWTMNDVTRAIGSRGWQFDVVDLPQAIRNATWTLTNRGVLERGERGQYRAAPDEIDDDPPVLVEVADTA